MEKRRKRMIKQCLSFALSLVMALTIVTPVKAAQQQYVPTQEDIEITKNIKDIQTAGYYSAALMKNGDLWTWGSMAAMDKYHAIDSSLYTPKTPSVFMTNVKEFVLTDTYYAAIKNDGTLWMWGCDTNGELGIGDCELNNFFPRQVNIPKRVKKVILSNKGWNKTAAITEDGDLYMWGDNSAYGLGIGENSDNSKSYNTPQKVNGISDVSDVSICGSTTTAITSSGKVYAWGNIYEYMDQMTHYTPEEVKNIEHISGQITKIQFSQAGYTVLTENGDLYAWYYSDMDENYAGRNDSEDKTIPKMILSNIKSYESGTTSFAVTKSGEVYSWGLNSKGEAGLGTYGNSSWEDSYVLTPTKMNISNVNEIVKTENFKGISGAYAAITNDKKLYMWGSNFYGIFGNGKEPNTGAYDSKKFYMVEANPVQIADQVKNASYYSYESSFYLKTDGSLWASGNARYGVLGEQRDEDVTQNEFYRNPILITLKGKSPSLTVKDDNNSGITDSGEPDSGDIDDGDHGSNQKPDQGNKDNAGDKQQDQVGGQIKPSTSATKKPSTTTAITVSGTNILKVQNIKGKKAKIRWKKNTKAAGYQIQYSMKKNFKSGVKTVNIKKNKTVSATIKKLKKKKTYYVRIRCMKKSGMKTIYSKWSSVKKVKIKK